MSTETRHRLINATLFQLLWFACVAGAGAGHPWLGPVVFLAFAAWHVPRSASPRAELLLAGAAAVVGWAFDSLQVATGLVLYASPGAAAGMAPPWIVVLWAGFALTVNSSMAWLRGRPWLAALLGATAGPLSFWSGSAVWQAVEFTAPAPLVLALYGAAWAAILPLLFLLGETFATRPFRRSWSRPNTAVVAAD